MPSLNQQQAADDEPDTLESKASAEVQAEAEAAGWIPPSRFKGEALEFRDADEYLERAHSVLPIVNAQNRKLKAELDTERAERAKLQAALNATQTAVAALEESHAEDVKEQVTLARNELKSRIRAASEAGDHDAIAELTMELGDLNEAEREAKQRDKDAKARVAAGGGTTAPPQSALTPEFQAWMAEPRNSWFGSDDIKTGTAMGIATKLRKEIARSGETISQVDFLRRLDTELEALEGSRPASKVDGGSRGGTRSGGGGKSFSDLPKEARDACRSFTSQLVGPNKRYKTAADWEKAYATKHFARQQERA